MNEKIKYWVNIAKYDIISAETMFKGRRYLYVGFMCHQTIEKILKAYYVKVNSSVPPFTHNLVHLAEKSGMYEKFSENQKGLIDLLRPLNIEARYPAYKERLIKELNKRKCREILRLTKELFKWIEKQL